MQSVAVPVAFFGPDAAAAAAFGDSSNSLLEFLSAALQAPQALPASEHTSSFPATRSGYVQLLPMPAATLAYAVHFFVSSQRKATPPIRVTVLAPPKQPFTRAVPGIAFKRPTAEGMADLELLNHAMSALGDVLSSVTGAPSSGDGRIIVPRYSSERKGLLFWSLKELTGQSASLSALSTLLESLLDDPQQAESSPVTGDDTPSVEGQVGQGTPQQRKVHPPPETGMPPYEPTGQYLLSPHNSTFLLFLQHALLLRNPAGAVPLPGTCAALLRQVGTPVMAPAALQDLLLRPFDSIQLGSHAPPTRGLQRLGEPINMDSAASARCFVYHPLIGDTAPAVATVLSHLLRDPSLKYLCGGRDENSTAVFRASRMFDQKHAGSTLPLLPTGELGLNAADEWQGARQWLLGRASASMESFGGRSSSRGIGGAFADLRRQYSCETPVLRCLQMPLWHWFRVHLDQAVYAPGGIYDDLVQTWLLYLTPWRCMARDERRACAPDRASCFHAAHSLLGSSSAPDAVGGASYIMKGITARWATTLSNAFGDFQQCPVEYTHYWRGWVALHYSFYVHLLGVYLAKLRAANVDFLWADVPSSAIAAGISGALGSPRAAPSASAGEGESIFKDGRVAYASPVFSPGPRFPALEQLERVLDVFEPCVVDTLWQCGYLLHGDTQARSCVQQQDAGGLAESEAFINSQSPMSHPLPSPSLSTGSLQRSALHTRTVRWAGWQRSAQRAGDKLIPGSLRSHCNVLGVDASAISETLLPMSESLAAHDWRDGTDDVHEAASAVCAEDLQLWSVPEGAALYDSPPPDPTQLPTASMANQMQVMQPEDAFEVPAERRVDVPDAASQVSRRAALGVVVQLLLAIDQRKRALGEMPSASPVGQQGARGSLLDSLKHAARGLQSAAAEAWATRNAQHTVGPSVRRLQHAVCCLVRMYGLEHVVEQFNRQVSSHVPAQRSSSAAQASSRGSKLEKQRRAGEYDGHLTHIPVRQDELVWLVKATQAWSSSIARGVARVLVPASHRDLAAGTSDELYRAEWLSQWLDCSLWALFVEGSTVLTENGVDFHPVSEHAFLLSDDVSSKRLLVPNFLRLLARWRVALLLTLLLGCVAFASAGASSALAVSLLWVAMLASPLLVSM